MARRAGAGRCPALLEPAPSATPAQGRVDLVARPRRSELLTLKARRFAPDRADVVIHDRLGPRPSILCSWRGARRPCLLDAGKTGFRPRSNGARRDLHALMVPAPRRPRRAHVVRLKARRSGCLSVRLDDRRSTRDRGPPSLDWSVVPRRDGGQRGGGRSIGQSLNGSARAAQKQQPAGAEPEQATWRASAVATDWARPSRRPGTVACDLHGRARARFHSRGAPD